MSGNSNTSFASSFRRFAAAISLPMFVLASSPDAVAEPQPDRRPSVLATSNQPALPAGEELPYVDRHTVLVIDVSGSIDQNERNLMMEGYGRALMSEEVQSQFRTGLHYAMSIVFFADRAFHAETRVIRNPEEAAEFANRYFYDFTEGKPRGVIGGVGSGTNITSPLNIVRDLFNAEPNYGFRALTRTVVLAGDGTSDVGNEATIAGLVQQLAETRGATVFGIPIVTPAEAASPVPSPGSLTDYFARALATPQGLTHLNEGQYPTPVLPGRSYPAAGFEGIGQAVAHAMRMNFF